MIKPIDNDIIKCLRDALAFVEAELDSGPVDAIDQSRLALLRVERVMLKTMITTRVSVMNVVAVKRRA